MAKHPLLTALALLFSAATTVYSVVWMYAVRREPTAYLGVGFDSGLKLSGVVPGSPADRAGLRPKDRLIAVNGRPLNTASPLTDAIRQGRPGDRVRLGIERAVAGPLTVDAVLEAPPAPRRTLTERIMRPLLGSYPVLFLLVSVPVLLLRVADPSAWRLALLFAGFIAMAPAFELELPEALRGFSLAYKVVFDGLSGALLLYFFSVFPASSPLDRLLPGLKWLWLAVGVLVSLPLAAWAFAARSLAPISAWLEHLDLPLRGPLLVYFFGGSGLGLLSLIANAFWGPAAVQRKSRVILAGMLLGFGPVLGLFAAAVYAHKDPYEFPFWVWAACVLLLFLVPLSFAYAVVRHRVLEIPVLLRRSARYLLVQRGSLGLLLLLGGAATFSFSQFFGQMAGPRAQTAATGLAVGFGTLLVWTGAHVQRRVRKRIDRAFFRTAYDAREILEDLAEKIRSVTSRDDLAELLTRHLTTALMPRSLVLYLESDEGWLTRLRGAGPDRLATTQPLLVDLARRGRPRELVPGEALGPFEPDCLVPVLGRTGGLAGLMGLGPRLSEEPYSGEDMRLLASVASQAGLAHESLRLAEQMTERLETERRAAHEMELAKAVQTKLLPQRPPVLGTLECGGRCLQARAVGGDYYDFLELGAGRLGLVIADISGKGFPAALLMASLHASVRSRSAQDLLDLPRQLAAVNQLLYRSSDTNRYATLFLGVYDDTRRRLLYANCGHNPPILLRRSGAVERLRPTGPALGLIEDWSCATGELDLAKGDLLALFSDGITEAFSDAGEEFGEDRLLQLLCAHRELPVASLLDVVMDRVPEWSGSQQDDDETLVLARVR